MNSMRLATPALVALALGFPVALLSGYENFAAYTATQPANGFLDPVLNLIVFPLPTPEQGEFPIEGFRIYRKLDLQAPYPRFPVNGSGTLRVLSDCEAIKSLIPEGSEDWERIVGLLTGDADSIGSLQPLSAFLGKRRQKLLGPGGLAQIPAPPQRTPCDIWKLERDSDEFQGLEVLARSSWRLAVVLGRGYRDTSVIEGQTYYYRINGVDSRDREVVLQSDIQITAGEPVPAATPQDIAAIAGDDRVLVHWSESSGVSGYNVYRRVAGAGSYQLVNEASLAAHLTRDFDDQPIAGGAEADGFIDFRRWTLSGAPTYHEVGDAWVWGPRDDITYEYRVAAVDLLGREGELSDAVEATPRDTTPPHAPSDVAVVPDEGRSRIEIRWSKIQTDTDGHREDEVIGYRVYRRSGPYTSEDDLEAIGDLVPQPGKGETLVFYFDIDDPDSNPLRPPYGEQKFWYHVRCVDASDNPSAPSAGIGGHLSDIAPPASPQSISSEGFEDHIRIDWSIVSELDLDGDETIAGYYVYRSLCDRGEWPCTDPPTINYECEAGFAPLGFVSQEEALENGAYLEDYTVPEESPLCYMYLVKTVDMAQNLSGPQPPDPETDTSICERLRDRRPPEAAVVRGLHARRDGILVQWVGAPVQDIAAYHVYRATSETGAYTWVGGWRVDPSGPLDEPYPTNFSGCVEIPLGINEGMYMGEIVDTSAEPKTIYFYKVAGVDLIGNETPLDEAVGVSTFTFTTQPASALSLRVTVEAAAGSEGLRLEWDPPLDVGQQVGFFVQRAERAIGPFITITPRLGLLNSYLDSKIAPGREYFYRVFVVHEDGRVGGSATESGQFPE